MTIVVSVPQTIPLRANLLAATAALAHLAARRRQLDQSSSIDQPGLNRIYLLTPRRRSKQPISSTRRQTDRTAPPSKSP
jgi:hypothetical protein